ncbi:MAG: serpin family protein [Mediterranea sp.]|jgi:serpin B|nr:serpin family protein [Mediterranea sp.]
MKALKLISSAVLLIVVAACTNEVLSPVIPEIAPTSPAVREPTSRIDPSLSIREQQMTDGNNVFAWDLFRQIVKTEKNKNIFISPLSASYALSMLGNGAASSTLEELKAVLGSTDYSMTEINAYYKKLTEYLLKADGATVLGIANSLWMNKDFTPYDTFVKTNKDSYQAEVQSLDFAQPASRKTINDWVSDKTYKYIPELLDKLLPTDILFLINTLYFDGLWSTQFQESKGDFTGSNGTKITTQCLTNEKYYRYYTGDGLQIAELPYGNETYSMVMVLPEAGLTLQRALEKCAANWNKFSSGLKETLLRMSLPTFKMDYSRELTDDLKALGMTRSFSVEADFSALAKAPLMVSEVLQKTKIDVNKYGTTAAGATVIKMGLTSPGNEVVKPTPVDFIVNRPFLFAIRENSTNALLFIGQIEELK